MLSLCVKSQASPNNGWHRVFFSVENLYIIGLIAIQQKLKRTWMVAGFYWCLRTSKVD